MSKILKIFFIRCPQLETILAIANGHRLIRNYQNIAAYRPIRSVGARDEKSFLNNLCDYTL